MNETCDDGNTNNGDGCSATCTVEPDFECSQANADAGIASACGPMCGNGVVQRANNATTEPRRI